jgi:hypothetical protein
MAVTMNITVKGMLSLVVVGGGGAGAKTGFAVETSDNKYQR